ncbi:DinB family protein [Rossellomorea aquimaris]|uniref:DinB family protein n=1 Tax=Rossellomorea aquimaris TaxID=189382 RepID=UPI0007D09D73|nr:DinB family protein [Rossellomorea aquimaris]
MNLYCQSTLNQMEVAISSIVKIIDGLTEEDLHKKPVTTKRSIGELLIHTALICKADYYLLNEATKEEMDTYYSSVSLNSLTEIQEELIQNFTFLKERVSQLTELELEEETTAYWGVTYSRFEWLVEIVAHLYHHRGQLHTILIHCFDLDLQVPLFE